MKVDLGIWDRLSRLIMVLLISAALLAVAVWYLPLIQKNEQMRLDILMLESRIEQARELNRQLQAQIDAHDDPRTVQQLGRERLKLALPGEMVIRWEELPERTGSERSRR